MKEFHLRQKQLEDLDNILDQTNKQIMQYEQESAELVREIKERKNVLKIKTGRLEYIWEEKEATFNKLNLLMSKSNANGKNQKENFWSGVWSRFFVPIKGDLNNIDITDGKVLKNIG